MKKIKRYYPFISVIGVIALMMSYLVVRMEVVRLGYELGKLRHIQKMAMDDRSELELTYNKLMRPGRLDQIGTVRLSLNRAQKKQIVMMADSRFISFKR